MTPDRVRAILDFWFLPLDHPGHNHYRPEWHWQDASFDVAIRARFGSAVEAALAGNLQIDATDARAGLAAILLLDEFPRKLFRGTAPAEAGIVPALALAKALVSAGRDKNLPPIQRWFVFMPFLHSNQLIDRECAVALFAGLRREAQETPFELAYDTAVQQRDALAGPIASRP